MTSAKHMLRFVARWFSIRYDHLDRRIQKITPDATHSFFYDGWMLVKEVIANTNGTTSSVEYHWGNDLSGSRGGEAGKTSTCGDDPAAFPIRFSTKYHDIESGLYYYTKRFYIPSLHR